MKVLGWDNLKAFKDAEVVLENCMKQDTGPIVLLAFLLDKKAQRLRVQTRKHFW